MKKSLIDFAPLEPVSKRRQITEHVRKLVLSGELAAGTKLPPTHALAEEWKAPMATVQAALAPLVKEGLLYRRPRVGTIVCERERSLTRVGLYLTGHRDIDRMDTYISALVTLLRKRLAERGIACSFWVDPRPPEEQESPWESLLTAAEANQVQAIIVPSTDKYHDAWLRKLPIPVAFNGTPDLPSRVTQDHGQLAEAGIRELAALGCRSVGLISVTKRAVKGQPREQGDYEQLCSQAERTAAELGLEMREEWIRTPPPEGYVSEAMAERFGYESIAALWQEPVRPEGLLVFTDVAARGVVVGLLERGVSVPEELKLVLHRNVEVGMLCPFPVSYLDTSIILVVDSLIKQIEHQYDGKKVRPIQLPVSLSRPEQVG